MQKRISETVATAPWSAVEGIVIYCIINLIDKDPNQSTKTEFIHIAKWANTFAKGWDTFTREILIQRSRLKPKPLAFLMMVNGEAEVQVTHGFGQLALESKRHPLDAVLGCFLGDCTTATTIDGETIFRDPDFNVFRDETFVAQVPVKLAADSSIKKMDDDTFINGNARGNAVFVPRYLPLPLAWLPYFMEKPRSHKEASPYMMKQLAKIQSPVAGVAKTIAQVLNWFKAACTRLLESPTYSILNISSNGYHWIAKRCSGRFCTCRQWYHAKHE
jgi:hypothetical protein